MYKRGSGNNFDLFLFLIFFENITRTYSCKSGDQAMWIKDAAAGFGIVLFMVSAFVLASGASAFTI